MGTPNGKALIFSAPSGSGKTTVVRHLLQNNPELGFSISACTRDRRGRNEIDGKDYYFLSQEEFKNKIDQNEFVEWQEVYEGSYYGTLKSEVDRLWSAGKIVVFDVDVKGGVNLKKYFGKQALAVFVKAPSEEVLKQRLMARGSESDETLSRRLYKVRFELEFQDEFDAVLTNDDLEEALFNAQKLYDDFKSNKLDL